MRNATLYDCDWPAVLASPDEITDLAPDRRTRVPKWKLSSFGVVEARTMHKGPSMRAIVLSTEHSPQPTNKDPDGSELALVVSATNIQI